MRCWGPDITQYVLEKAVDNGLFDRDTLFQGHYDLIDGRGPARYRTEYDRFFDRNVVKILKAFQANDDIYYAYVINNDGFIPAHTDAGKSKTKFNRSDIEFIRNESSRQVSRSVGENEAWVRVPRVSRTDSRLRTTMGRVSRRHSRCPGQQSRPRNLCKHVLHHDLLLFGRCRRDGLPDSA